MEFFCFGGFFFFFSKANPVSVLMGQEWLNEVMSSSIQRIQRIHKAGDGWGKCEHFAVLVALWERKPRCRKPKIPS